MPEIWSRWFGWFPSHSQLAHFWDGTHTFPKVCSLIHISIYLSVQMPACLAELIFSWRYVYQSMYPFICLSTCLLVGWNSYVPKGMSINPYIHSYVFPLACLLVGTHLFHKASLSINEPIYICICPLAHSLRGTHMFLKVTMSKKKPYIAYFYDNLVLLLRKYIKSVTILKSFEKS